MENELYHYGILGMKWGVRRYQNKDGSLTAEGKKRYDRDIAENLAKKKDSRIDTSSPDPNRWVREDIERSKRVIDSGSDLIRQAKSIERDTSPRSTKKRLNVSNMSDKELRDKINRELLERQYSDIFGEEAKVSRGRQFTRETLEIAGTALAATSSVLGIMLAIKQLKG